MQVNKEQKLKPTRQEIKDALLKVLVTSGGQLTSSQAYDKVAKELGIPAHVLNEETSGESWWNNAVRWAREDLVREGYIKRPEDAQRGLWVLSKGKVRSIDNIPEEVTTEYIEGSVSKILVNSYERNIEARSKCIAHHNAICSVCKFDFGKVYGSLGKGFIHVHHIIPISSIKESYKLDPISDLRPVCPNCHAMLHTEEPPLSIDNLKSIMFFAKDLS